MLPAVSLEEGNDHKTKVGEIKLSKNQLKKLLKKKKFEDTKAEFNAKKRVE